ncbi:MAG: tyrosine-protein phosphatase [Hungatella sp.]
MEDIIRDLGGARIVLEGLPNTRDLGGYRTTEGNVILPKCLIRSGALTDMTVSDQTILFENYKIRTVVDFRTSLEARQKPEPKIAGVNFVFNPILNEEMAGFTHEENADADPIASFLKHVEMLEGNPEIYLDKLYEDLVSDPRSMAQYGKFLDLVSEQEDGAILWHCSIGKDRVGIGTALLLSALGVSKEIVWDDFVKTNDYLIPQTKRMLDQIRGQNPDSKLLTCAKVLNEVRRSYIESAYRTIEAQFGTVDHYLVKGLGLTAEKQDKLKQKYLEVFPK